MPTLIEKRKTRVKKTAEVFTPDFLVKEMVDKLPKEVWKKDKTFCDPACGDGNFLIEILSRKIKKGHNPLEALKTIFGADIMSDNIAECRHRLLKEVQKHEPITVDHVKAVMKNIVWVNPKKFPNGSLDYDFSFSNSIKDKDAEKWLKFFAEETEEPEVKSEVAEDDMSDLF